jgi:hypothetical protein
MHELRQRHCQIRSASVVDGISDFDTLHSGKHDEEVQLCAFDILVEGSDDLRKLPLHLRETSLERPLARRPECIFVNPFERGEIGPDLYRAACRMGLEGGVERSHAEALVTGNAFARKSPPHPILAQCRLAASKNLRSEAGTSSYSMKRRRTSSAMSTVASRDQPFGGVEGDDAHRVFVLPSCDQCV